MTVIEVGYVIISKQVSDEGLPVGYFYREKPDNDRDSGWRFFSGNEDQGYADEASNFAKHNASTIIDIEPEVRDLLGHSFPISFERVEGQFEMIKEDEE
jgi:hypothetical protein